MRCQDCEKRFVEALYGELEGEAKRDFAAHLSSCSRCSRMYAEWEGALRTMSRRERPDPGQPYWDGYWARLEARLEPGKEPSKEPGEPGRRGGWLDRVVPGWSNAGLRWAYGVAAAVVLIAAGALVGRMILPGRAPETGTVAGKVVTPLPTGTVSDATSNPAVAEACARRYIEDSQVLLLALINDDPGADGAFPADWSGQKKRSRELVAQAASLKGELNDPKQRRLRDLVNDLELILMQIANLESEGDMAAVELIRSSVDNQGLMFKINLEQLRGAEAAELGPGACDA
jgi:hypothetical protein